MKPLKEAGFELGFEAGRRFIQTEYRRVYVGGLGQAHEKMGMPGEVTSCVNYREKYGMLDML